MRWWLKRGLVPTLPRKYSIYFGCGALSVACSGESPVFGREYPDPAPGGQLATVRVRDPRAIIPCLGAPDEK